MALEDHTQGDASTEAKVPMQWPCVDCGYDLTATAVGGRCPECGLPVATSLRHAPRDEVSGLAQSALLSGIASVIFGCIPLGPLAIGLALAVFRTPRLARRKSGNELFASIGLVFGLVSTVILILVLQHLWSRW